MKFAKARTHDRQRLPQADGLLVLDETTGQGHALSPVAAAVWQAADGTRPVEALVDAARAADASADPRLVWQILDGLADAGLLEDRLAPPAPVVDRRAVLRTVGVAAAALAFAPLRSRAQEKDEPLADEPADAPADDAAGAKDPQARRRAMEERAKQQAAERLKRKDERKREQEVKQLAREKQRAEKAKERDEKAAEREIAQKRRAEEQAKRAQSEQQRKKTRD